MTKVEGLRLRPGDVVQVTKQEGIAIGWYGALVIVTEVKSWGLQGYVHVIENIDERGSCAFIRLAWDQVTYVGEVDLMLASPSEEDSEGWELRDVEYEEKGPAGEGE